MTLWRSDGSKLLLCGEVTRFINELYRKDALTIINQGSQHETKNMAK